MLAHTGARRDQPQPGELQTGANANAAGSDGTWRASHNAASVRLLTPIWRNSAYRWFLIVPSATLSTRQI